MQLVTVLIATLLAQSLDPALVAEESARIETIARVSPSVVAVFLGTGGGGGSGVLISADGFALTNFHVTGDQSPWLKCGLPDGKLYDAVIVGLDPVGDVALIKLLGRDDFPFAPMGNSDDVRMGDIAYAIGNPFLLATDFAPTVTMGVISGVHRYQAPSGEGKLEYTDCLQTDAAVNPGNSGGPLFDAEGRIIGINGRISLEKRGRVSVGVGYAISINQIKNFLDAMRGGWLVDHATMGATAQTDDEGRVVVRSLLETSDAFHRGLRVGDELVSFASRPLASTNEFKNVLGTLPAGWRVPLTFRRDGEKIKIWVRLIGTGLAKPVEPSVRPQRPAGPAAKRAAPAMPQAVKDVFVKKPGFANFYFNALERERLLEGIKSLGDFTKETASWELTFRDAGEHEVTIKVGEEGAAWIQGSESAVYQPGESDDLAPLGSGGLLAAAESWRQMLLNGTKWFSRCDFAGSFPNGAGQLEPALLTERSAARVLWMFDPSTGQLAGFEFFPSPGSDPCEIRFSDYRPISGRLVPHQWDIAHAGQKFASLRLKTLESSP